MPDAEQPRLGATRTATGTRFSVWSSAAERIWLSLFDGHGETETDRIELARGHDGIFSAEVEGVGAGRRYGFRVDGPYDPDRGFWFDPHKLLSDPYALQLDRHYRYDPRLGASRDETADTAPLMPKCVVADRLEAVPAEPPLFRHGGFIYELNVRGFTMRHPDVPRDKRGTIAALAEPAVIDHLVRLGVGAVELMPVNAWIDERHLPPLGLSNAWGYNPVNFLALDPRLAPGGWIELRNTVKTLREAGIGTIIDVVFNHTGESDRWGPTLSLRGLDANSYFRHADDGTLVNDTGTGNTLRCDHPAVQRLVLDSLRHFVRQAGVDGFRFDLAPVLGRDRHGFSPEAALLGAIRTDPALADRILIAEPWDIGPGGYQLGNFPPRFLEWNDRYRDDVRRFWRGDPSMLGALAARLSGSSDIFGRSAAAQTRSVNFIAAHDGMTLADLTAFSCKHNEANGENNRDGHNDNHSWNFGIEGRSDDRALEETRHRDIKALIGTLFASRGTIMLTAGDEFGRTQGGNNNAYAQDNPVTWIDWDTRNTDLQAWAERWSQWRHRFFHEPALFLGEGDGAEWLGPDGRSLTPQDWGSAHGPCLAFLRGEPGQRMALLVNRAAHDIAFRLPLHPGCNWRLFGEEPAEPETVICPARSVLPLQETQHASDDQRPLVTKS